MLLWPASNKSTMKTRAATKSNKAALFALLTVVSFCSIFFFAPVGGFTVWITVGCTIYFLFLSIYSLVHAPAKPYTRPRHDPKEDEMKSYIRRHMRILLGMFLGALIFVLIFLWFVL